jgi:hypothetical protein
MLKGEIIKDVDDEIRTTVQSQIYATATLGTEEPFEKVGGGGEGRK